MTLVIAVIGSKESGKTTTIEYLTRQLVREGLKVGAIKHIHDVNFSIDTPRKDTFRFAQAGAKIVVTAAEREVALIKKISELSKGSQLEEVFNLVNKENLDVVFLEGFHSTIVQRNDLPKIITARTEEDMEKSLKETAPPILAVTGLVANKIPKPHTSLKIPVIDVLTEGTKLLKLVKKVLAGRLAEKL